MIGVIPAHVYVIQRLGKHFLMPYNETDMDIITRKLRHLKKHFSFTDEELAVIAKLYAGEPYPADSPAIAHLYEISEKTCEEYNLIFANRKLAHGKSKKQLLRLLFPTLPSFPGLIRRGLKLVIGMVDIEDNVFINVCADFGKNTLVHLDKWSQLGPNFSLEEEQGVPAKTIEVGHDSWLGGKVKVKAGVTVGPDSTVGSGAYVAEDLPASSLALGRPAAVRRPIDPSEPFHDGDCRPYSDEELEKIRLHYAKLGIRLPKKQFQSIFTGHAFSTLALRLDILYLITQSLCAELDDPDLDPGEREEIIDKLFPIHGKNVTIGKNFFLDLAGTVSLGDDVVIGDRVSIGGLVRVGNGAKIGDGCLLFGSNHPTSPTRRKTGWNEGLGLSIPVAYVPINVEDGAVLANDVCITPKATVRGEIPSGALVDPKGKIIP